MCNYLQRVIAAHGSIIMSIYEHAPVGYVSLHSNFEHVVANCITAFHESEESGCGTYKFAVIGHLRSGGFGDDINVAVALLAHQTLYGFDSPSAVYRQEHQSREQ